MCLSFQYYDELVDTKIWDRKNMSGTYSEVSDSVLGRNEFLWLRRFLLIKMNGLLRQVGVVGTLRGTTTTSGRESSLSTTTVTCITRYYHVLPCTFSYITRPPCLQCLDSDGWTIKRYLTTATTVFLAHSHSMMVQVASCLQFRSTVT